MAEDIVASIEGMRHSLHPLPLLFMSGDCSTRPGEFKRCNEVLADGDQTPTLSIPGERLG